MKDVKIKYFIYFTAALLAVLPFVVLGGENGLRKGNMGFSTRDLLDPDKWFDALKRNITIPIPLSSDQQIIIPTPEEALQKTSPKFQEINRGVREETGLDLAKFIGWFAKVLKVFFQIVVDLLETVARSFGP